MLVDVRDSEVKVVVIPGVLQPAALGREGKACLHQAAFGLRLESSEGILVASHSVDLIRHPSWVWSADPELLWGPHRACFGGDLVMQRVFHAWLSSVGRSSLLRSHSLLIQSFPAAKSRRRKMKMASDYKPPPWSSA